ncbi:small ribosomal subunit protein mS26 [Neocloeon triangulifer]|uniref:small ribosomal subunit protein mS26 n=1 Tax=Neocloeon triangulifer TaxID=2078957 RepID=UPI00286F0F76|nr:small ribosomal subunit protein mS26 [Neocloeon triangulifer]
MSFCRQALVAEKLVRNLLVQRFAPSAAPNVIVRWRKPRSLGTAPSKMFRIPKKPEIPEDELAEIRRLYAQYRTYMKSIRVWLAEDLKQQETAAAAAVAGSSGEEAEFARCLQINDEWNKQVAAQREKRLAAEKEKLTEKILTDLEKDELERSQRKAEILQMVALEKELSAKYITAANIDKAIELALSEEVDHNFAIDREGNFYRGFDMKPTPKDEETQS